VSEKKGPPSAEEEALWRKRFAVFAMLRVSGLAFMLAGIAIAFTPLLRPGGWPLVGAVLVMIGVVEGLVLPFFVRKHWEPK